MQLIFKAIKGKNTNTSVIYDEKQSTTSTNCLLQVILQRKIDWKRHPGREKYNDSQI